MTKETQPTYFINSKQSVFSLNFKEVWDYRDLLLMLVKKDFITFYKQTVLGPLWFIVQPLLTTVIYMVLFGSIAKLSTDGVPQVLFYLSGITIWNYFSESLTKTSSVFTANAGMFGKMLAVGEWLLAVSSFFLFTGSLLHKFTGSLLKPYP
jgi:lipopolysaccharide transport system permease protein